MKKTDRRFCVFIVILFILPGLFLAGCSKPTENYQGSLYIDYDTPWYDCDSITFMAEDIGNTDCSVPVYADPDVKVFYRFLDDETNDNCSLIYFADDNDQIKQIDLVGYFPDSSRAQIYNCFRKEGDLYLVILNVVNGENHNCIYRFSSDASSMEFIFEIEADDDHQGMYVDKVIFKNNSYYAHVYYLDGYTYLNAFIILDEQFNRLLTKNISEETYMWAVNDIGELLYVGWNQSTPTTCTGDVYKIDPESGETTALRIDSLLLDKYRMGIIQNDCYIYCSNNDLTMTKLNIQTGEETLVLDYNNSNANLANIRESQLLYCDDTEIISIKSWFYPSEKMEWKLYSLHKTDENPNAGKRIVKAATIFQINILAANAIIDFNASSSELYIYLTMDYSWLTFTDYDMNGDGLVSNYNQELAILSTLKNDIRAGIGPDILLDFGRFATLNNPDYLIDLAEMINDPEQLDRDDYFSNFFDAYTINGKLYQIPVSACVAGIYAYENWEHGSQNGFSFDDYREYVSEYCDGTDPLGDTYGRELGLDYLVRSNYPELHNAEGLIYLDNGTFRDICDYIREFDAEQHSGANCDGGEYVSFTRIHFDLSRMLLELDKKLYGLPSETGEAGPVAVCNESVAITSCSDQPDELLAFVRSILSYDIQITNVNYNPINREAMEYYANDGLEYSNSYLEEHYRIRGTITSDLVDEYIGYIESANTCWLADDYSLLILNEELQPYYYDQKSLDDVIPIAEDRINNMMEENS